MIRSVQQCKAGSESFCGGYGQNGENIMGVGSGAYGTFMTIQGVKISGGRGSIYPATIIDIRGSGKDLEDTLF